MTKRAVVDGLKNFFLLSTLISALITGGLELIYVCGISPDIISLNIITRGIVISVFMWLCGGVVIVMQELLDPL